MSSKSLDRKHLHTPRKYLPDDGGLSKSKTSASPSDDESDSDEDENQRRKYISLNAGQALSCVLPITNQGNIPNLVLDKERSSPLESSYGHNQQVFFLRDSLLHGSLRHKRNSSSPPKFFYDSIHLNNDFEYGFNPLRARGSKSGNTVRLRPLSLYSPQPPRFRSSTATAWTPDSVNTALCDVSSRWSHSFCLKSLPVRSFAKTDFEAKLEHEILMLRSQSNDLNLQGCNGVVLSKQEMEDGLACARRRRFVRRQLSFGDQSRNNWKKTLSLDSGLATDGSFGKFDGIAKEPVEACKSEETLDKLVDKDIDFRVLKHSHEYLSAVNGDAVIAWEIKLQDVFAEPDQSSIFESVGSQSASVEKSVPTPGVRPPPPVDDKPLAVEVHLRGKDSSDHKATEKNKRRGSIPHILSAFKLPNRKAFKKLIKRKSPDANLPIRAESGVNKSCEKSASVGIEATSLCDRSLKDVKPAFEATSRFVEPAPFVCDDKAAPAILHHRAAELEGTRDPSQIIPCSFHSSDARPVTYAAESINECKVCDAISSTPNVESRKEDQERPKEHDKRNVKSSSVYSLPRVDEDSEVHEFTSPLERKSRSSCSIAVAKTTHHIRHQRDLSILERRMSDTALSWKSEKSLGCSPGKRFVRRLLSPVVCGLPPPGKYSFIRNDSLQSLISCDSSSLTSDTDTSFHLFDFSSQELAEEMALVDKELLVRISWDELALCGWMSSDKYILASNVMKMVQFFNRIAMLVASAILAEETAYRRARVIRKSVKLAIQCRRIRNFNSLKAVLGGLQCTPIFRLKSTWKQVPSKYRRVFRELSELMSEENNFLSYRRALRVAMLDPPYLPFLGNFLTEIAHTEAFLAVNSRYRPGKSPTDPISTDLKNDTATLIAEDKPQVNISNCVAEDCETNHLEDGSRSLHTVDDCSSSSKPPSVTELILPVVSGVEVVKNSHSRSSSDDSGVGLNVNRLSHTFDDCEASPRESCVSSPEDERPIFERGLQHRDDVFGGGDELKFSINTTKKNETMVGFNNESNLPQPARNTFRASSIKGRRDSRKGYRGVNVDAQSPFRKSVSVDESLRYRTRTGIRHVLNNRPLEPSHENSRDYDNELTFWKYQIAAIQYRFVPRPYIRRFLMSWPFNTEEDNYRLSLKREPQISR